MWWSSGRGGPAGGDGSLVRRRGRMVVPVALASVAALAAACTSSEGSGQPLPAPPAAGAETTTITVDPARKACTDAPGDRDLLVWHNLGDVYERSLQAALARFSARHGVGVRAVHHYSGDELEDVLRRTGPAGTPDLILAAQDRVRELRDSGRFVPAQACATAVGLALDPLVFPVIREAFSVDGELQAVPLGASFPVLYVSPRRLAQIGVAAAPTDPAGWRTMLEQLRAAGVRDAMRFDPGVPVALAEQWAAQRGAPIVQVDDRGETRVRLDDGVRRDLEWLRDLERDGLMTPLPPGADHWDDALAMTDPVEPPGFAVHSSVAMGQARAFIEQGRFDAGRVQVTTIPAQGPGVLPGGDAWWLGGGPHNQPRRAFELATFLLTAEQQAELGATGAYVPVAPGAALLPAFTTAATTYPQLVAPARQLAAVDDPGRFGRTAVGGRRELREILQAATDAIRRGEDAGTALARAQREATAVVEAYRRTHR